MFLLPSIKPGVPKTVIVEEVPLLVASNSKEKERGKRFLTALMSKPIQDKLSETQGSAIPIRLDATVTNPTLAKVADIINKEGYTLIPRFWEATPMELAQHNSEQFTRFMLNPNEYMEVLEGIEKRAAEFWAKKK
jgi:multiple sugar transport system substrate-binding protein